MPTGEALAAHPHMITEVLKDTLSIKMEVCYTFVSHRGVKVPSRPELSKIILGYEFKNELQSKQIFQISN